MVYIENIYIHKIYSLFYLKRGDRKMKKIGLIITLVTTFILFTSTISVSTVLKKTDTESLEVVKEILDGSNWVNEIDADIGENITFKITVTYYNVTDPNNSHYAENIVVKDILPPCLDYIEGSASPFEPVSGSTVNEYVWNVPGTLHHGESYVITFNATVIDYGENKNIAKAYADEHCTGDELYGEDFATVNVDYPNPEIDLKKYVWDGNCFWVKETSAYPDEIVTFKIVVENTGSSVLNDIWVNDTLSESLEYVIDSSTPFEPIIDDQNLSWYFNSIQSEEIIEIRFNATVVGDSCETDINWAYVEAKGPCGNIVTDQDSAKVHVLGMCIEKEVWNDDMKSWEESTEVFVDETVRFRINIYYFGPKTLYNIKVKDVLPLCFEYDDNADPVEPEISGNTLWWNLSAAYDLYDGEVLTIEFDAIATGGLCDECINWVYVDADECSGRHFYDLNSAIVYVQCDFTANAGGPYYGEIDEDIDITATASDGNMPYTYMWDLDGDEEQIYDDYTSNDGEFIWSWSESGDFDIFLKVVDDDGREAFDSASVHINPGENLPPERPDPPTGPNNGKFSKVYTYIASTTDPNEDQIEYMFDWGDGTTSGWLGPYDSGEECSASHKWGYGSYQIKVKARDTTDFVETDWSDSLSISMPKAKTFKNTVLYNLLLHLIQRYPIFEQILKI